MTYGSICSGIEGATVAWHSLGWTAAWFAEVDPFCCALLKYHYPETPNYGDFTKIDSGSIDLLVGGTPCQDFSVAGLRKGLGGARGNLTLEFVALAGRLRPRWLVWENVPGILSIDGGRAFGAFLGLLGQCGYGFAYRILDAQHFGVPQRRRRVFVVGYLGDWRRAAAVLFERASLSGHPAPRREAGKDVARCVATGTNSQRYDWETETFAISGRAEYSQGLGTLRAQGGDLGGGSEMLIANPLPGHHQRYDLDNDTYVTATLGSGQGSCRYSQNGDLKAGHLIAFHGSQDPCVSGDVTHPLGQNQGQETCIAYTVHGTDKTQKIVSETDLAGCVRARPPGAQENSSTTVTMDRAGVRRLTPRECERLQGFPDDYTLIPYRAKPAADGPRYRALGNSFAVPVVRWIGERIQMVENL